MPALPQLPPFSSWYISCIWCFITGDRQYLKSPEKPITRANRKPGTQIQ